MLRLRRLLLVLMVALSFGGPLGYGWLSADDPGPAGEGTGERAGVRFHRPIAAASAPWSGSTVPGSPRSDGGPAVPPRSAAPSTGGLGSAATAVAGTERDGQDRPPRPLGLEALSDHARSELVEVAMDQLAQLDATCGDRLARPIALGAFATLDETGLVELELHPIAGGGGPIAPLDEALPEAWADCVDDVLWSQDWSRATAGVPELRGGGAVLEVALTTRADEP